MLDLKDKRVGIIGTGATAVQVVPRDRKSREVSPRLSANAVIGGCQRSA